ncbi:MAG: type II secretion system protein GspK [Victivallaceae bacterium]|nr:type II secretion system protein GspK [Victivallaceae bacterium]
MTNRNKNPIAPSLNDALRAEEGSALILVLVTLLTAALLTAAVVAQAKYQTFYLKSTISMQRSFYTLESAANRILWLLCAERTLHPDAIPGEVDYTETEYDRYLSDGVEHTIDCHGTKVSFVIHDAVSGFDFSNSKYKETIQKMLSASTEDDARTDAINVLLARLGDYNDSNDDINTDGMESGDYEQAGKAPLPRNAAMQMREELFYIEDFTQLVRPDQYGILSNVRLIPPENLANLSGTPSVFSADRTLLETYLPSLESSQIDEILEALETVKKEKTLLSDTVDELLYQSIRSKFRRNESGNYTVRIYAPSEDRRPSKRLDICFSGFDVTGPDNNLIRYLDYQFY